MDRPIKILLVEDNPGDARLLREAVAETSAPGPEWVTVDRLRDAMSHLGEESFDVVLLDLSLPDAQGFETFARAFAQAPDVPIVVLTGLDDEEMAVKTVHAGAQDYLVKGCVDGQLVLRALRYAIERRRAMQALRESERRFRAIFDQTFQFIGLLKPDGTLLEANQASLEYIGAAQAEVTGRPFWETPWWTHDPEAVRLLQADIAAAAAGQFVRREVTHKNADNILQTFDFSLKPVRDESSRVTLIIAEGRDISERKRAEEERALLLTREREKSEQLKLSVREAHHRIKNNLQAISDLLYLELTSGDSTSAADALRESIERIQAIATVHDLLSQDEDVRVVDARAVLDRLIPMVLHSSGLPAEAVALRTDVRSIPLSARRATALALITNELVSNAAKHALRGTETVAETDGAPGAARSAELTVALRQESEEVVLQVQDNGPGLPPGFSLESHSHVGLDVVRTLAERDLDGSFTLTSGDGVRAEVRFAW
jgi:PAS domain S-box-containing protein